ncbi:MAG: TadE family type IV pilus minor pilin [Nocardioides sp.]
MTAELAMVLPLLVAVTALLAWVLSLGLAQVQMIDAARETARALARGDDRATAVALGQRVAPAGTRFAVTESGGVVRVEATREIDGAGLALDVVPGVELRAVAVALMEDPQ